MKRRPMRLRPGLILALIAISGIVSVTPASAHGASTVRVDGDYGPYHIVAVTGPASDAKQVLVTVILTQRPDNSGDQEPQPVAGAAVRATLMMTGTNTSRAVYDVPEETRL